MTTTVGVRELKNRLSTFLRRVADGERITVTDRGRPIAVLGPSGESADAAFARELVRDGLASWSGGKPRGAARRIRLRGKFISETVIEERR
jgi:prevent-host-death family protein